MHELKSYKVCEDVVRMRGYQAVFVLACCCVALVCGQRSSREDCDDCDVASCSPPLGCVAGVVRDRCGCCDVCAKAEYELCDHARVRSKHELGKCGDELECRIR